MRIAIISKSDKSGGGASRVAEDLTKLLNLHGHIAHHYNSKLERNNEFSRPLYGRFQILFKYGHAILRKIGLSGLIPFELWNLQKQFSYERYDVIHIHDISSAISPFTLMYFSKFYPVVWTLHDCSAFTGGCLYPMGCKKFQKNCFHCPQHGQWPINSLVDLVFIDKWIKRKLHTSNKIHLLSPSKWMKDMAMLSGDIIMEPEIITNGVDRKIFHSIDKTVAKLALKIPTDRFIILVSSVDLNDERKGFKRALLVLKKISDLNPFVILVGTVDEKIEKELIGIDFYQSGYIADETILSRHYAAADIFLNCSLADNQPLVVLETMACGTPTVGFASGGIPELVLQNKTGFLVPINDIDALRDILQITVEDKSYVAWGQNAIKKAEEYDKMLFLAKHLKVYSRLI